MPLEVHFTRKSGENCFRKRSILSRSADHDQDRPAPRIARNACSFAATIMLAHALGLEAFGLFSTAWIAVLLTVSLQLGLVVCPMISIAPGEAGHGLCRSAGCSRPECGTPKGSFLWRGAGAALWLPFNQGYALDPRKDSSFRNLD